VKINLPLSRSDSGIFYMEKNNTILWSLRVNNTSFMSYLMGTMHAKSDDAYTHLEFVSEYLNSCNVFAAEIDLSNTYSTNNDFYLPDGINLLSLLGEKKYKKYAKIILKGFDFNLDQVLNFKPLITQNLVLEKLITESNSLSLDFKLHEIASDMGKELTGIETIEEQNNILNSIPIDIQLKMFIDGFSNIKRMKKALYNTIKLYKTGDIQGLYKEAKRGLGKLRKIMLFQRNEIMAERIIEKISRDSVFVGIGAAHLGGKKGVLKLLKDKGIQILPVMRH